MAAETLGGGGAELVEGAPDGMVVVDAEGTIVLVNRQAELLFGYERQELVGQPVEVLVPEPQRSVHEVQRRRYLGAPKRRRLGGDLSLYARRKDGSLFAAEISIGPLSSDDGLVVVATVRDVTERKKVERQRAFVQAELHRVARAGLEAPRGGAREAARAVHEVADVLGRIAHRARVASETLAAHAESVGPGGDPTLAALAQEMRGIVDVAEHGTALLGRLDVPGGADGRG